MLMSLYFICLSCFFIVMFDDYKTVIRAVSLMNCWLPWQPVAVFALLYFVQCSVTNMMTMTLTQYHYCIKQPCTFSFASHQLLSSVSVSN